MSFKDIFRTSFLEGFSGIAMGFKEILFVFIITSCLAFYIFLVYRVVTRRTFYSKNFNISLAILCLITAAIILTIQFSIVISLGMVGALSIVRFRTAIKDPMDLIFLFWSIGTGIICGAGLAEIAVLLALFATFGILILNRLPIVEPPMLLVVNGERPDIENALEAVVKKYGKFYKVKSRNISKGKISLILELRIKNGGELVQEISRLEAVNSVSLLEHDGEVTY